MDNIQKYAAEFIATFALTLTVSLSLISGMEFSLITPLAAAFTLGLFTYTVGGISGAHVNPAITIALTVTGKHSVKDAIGYIIAQFLGAGLVLFTLDLIHLAPSVRAATTYDMGIVELLGTFFLAFGIAAVAWGKVTQSASGLVVGGSLFLGIITAVAAGSLGVLNPAVAFGIGIGTNVYYILGPIAGAIIAMALYKGLVRK